MNLFLFRHADAAPGTPDESRALTPEGFAQIDRVAERLDPGAFAGVRRIEHSPYRRAVQSAEHFKKATGLDAPLHVFRELTPEDDPRATAATLSRCAEDRLLVGHNPHHETLAGLLLARGPVPVQIAFAKAGMLALERFAPPTKSAPYGYWQLKWFVVPGEVT